MANGLGLGKISEGLPASDILHVRGPLGGKFSFPNMALSARGYVAGGLGP